MLRKLLRWRTGRWVLAGALTVVLVPVLYWATLPWPGALRDTDPGPTAFMRYRRAQARDSGVELAVRQDWVALQRISKELTRAVLVAEDDRFRVHGGVDWLALAEETRYGGSIPPSRTSPSDLAALFRAVRYAVEHKDSIKGRSTITQQLAKNLYFTPDRSVRRKIGEFVVAARLERALDKDRILEIYLNTVEMGPGLFGMEAASQHYFGVPASALSRRQAATLAATLPHPLTSNANFRPGRMAWRRDFIVRRLGGDSIKIPEPIFPLMTDTFPPVTDTIPVAAESVQAIPDTARTIPDTVRTIPDTARTIPDTVRTIPDTLRAIPGAIRPVTDTVTAISRDAPRAADPGTAPRSP